MNKFKLLIVSESGGREPAGMLLVEFDTMEEAEFAANELEGLTVYKLYKVRDAYS